MKVEENLETFSLPSFVGVNGWPNSWTASANQPLSMTSDDEGTLSIEKSKKYTLHIALNATSDDLKELRSGRGVEILGGQRLGVRFDADGEGVGVQFVIHSYDAAGKRLTRHLLEPGADALYVAPDNAASLVMSLRAEGRGQLNLRGPYVRPVEAFSQLEPGLHGVGGKQPVAAENSRPSKTRGLGNTFNVSANLWGVGPEFEYAARIREATGTYETFALRSKSLAMRDAFARNASNLQFDYQQMIRVLQVIRGGKLRGGAAAVETWDPKGLLALARVLSNQRLLDTDLRHAELIFNAVFKVHGADVFGRTDDLIYIETLSALGEWRTAKAMVRKLRAFRAQPVQASLFTANAALEAEGREGEAEWTEVINRLYERESLSPVYFVDSNMPRLDRLRGTSEPRTVEGPLVSVIVPTYEGASLLRTTLESLSNQTWAALEIIVVDDGSSEENRQELKRVCADYPSAKLTLLEKNQGAYIARNAGLKLATGEFVTVHDDDDWSHPQKIEIQVRHLMENPELAGNMSRHARATDELLVARINNNPSFSQANFSSLLVKRGVFDEIGAWDEVNRGADAEFRDRLVSATGKQVEVVGEAPLSFTRTRAASLTAGELSRGYVDPARLFYVSAYQRAHAQGFVTEYARPENMKPGKRGAHLGHFDVVFMTDFRFPGGTTNLTVNEIERAADLGKNVGLLHIGSSVNGSRPPIHERALAAAERQNVAVLSTKDQFTSDLLLVRHPTVLQYVDNLEVNFSTEKCVVVVNHPPVLDGGKGFVYDLGTCLRNAERLFGEDVEFRAESGVTRKLVESVARDFEISRELWPGFASLRPRAPKEVDTSRKPVLGRHSRDNRLKWPDRASTILGLYGSSAGIDTRLMGGITSLNADLQEELRVRAEVHEFNELPVGEFLEGLDFWAYFHSKSLTESFGMATVEAMLSGAVVFLPSYMKENFGDGALYCEPKEVHALIDELWADPEAFRRQSAAGIRVAQELYTDKAFDARLNSLTKG